jgi:hypothetical protein
MLGAELAAPLEVPLEQADALSGCLGRGDAPGVLLGADRGERVVEGVLLVIERGEVGDGVVRGMIAHSRTSIPVRPPDRRSPAAGGRLTCLDLPHYA